MCCIPMRGVTCLDRGFFVSSLTLSGGRNVLHLCKVVDFTKGSPGKFLKAKTHNQLHKKVQQDFQNSSEI